MISGKAMRFGRPARGESMPRPPVPQAKPAMVPTASRGGRTVNVHDLQARGLHARVNERGEALHQLVSKLGILVAFPTKALAVERKRPG